MITVPAKAAHRRPSWLVVGLLAVSLGVAAIGLGLYWASLEEGGWPWTGSISYAGEPGPIEAGISHPDGRNEVFRAATEAEARAWMDRRDKDLKGDYNLDERIAAGRVLAPSEPA